jgi:hypothetical protein
MHGLSSGGIMFETDQLSSVVKVHTNYSYSSVTTQYSTTTYNGTGIIPVMYKATRTSSGELVGRLGKSALSIEIDS